MTRVEKYRHYREEIANMKFGTSTNKKIVSEEIGRICNENESSKLNYEQVINLFETYDPDAKTTKRKHHISFRKSQIIYWSVAAFVILGLVIGIIITAVNL